MGKQLLVSLQQHTPMPPHLDLVRDRLFRSRDRFWYGLLERLLFLEFERRLDLLPLRLQQDSYRDRFILNLQQISSSRFELSPVSWTWAGPPPPGLGPGPGPRASFTVFACTPCKKKKTHSPPYCQRQSLQWWHQRAEMTVLTSGFNSSRNERLCLSDSSHGFFDFFTGGISFQAGAQV